MTRQDKAPPSASPSMGEAPRSGGGGARAEGEGLAPKARWTWSRAKKLRAEMTPHERAMWGLLREGELAALNWRRQAPFGAFILDFVSHPARLVVEVDGAQHAQADQAQHDAQRTNALEREGYRVLRFWNVDVMKAKAGVWDAIHRAAMQTPARTRIERWRKHSASGATSGKADARHPLSRAARDSSPIEGEQ